MTKSMKLEKRLNNAGVAPVWVFSKGGKYYLQSVATGNVFKEFSSYEMAESYVEQIEERNLFIDLDIDEI